ncbi:MAG: hypothetical protein JO356_08715 [Acidobacteria bacterium]|nr:hypothetical protein [Acidobacteriota bacterium]
MPRGGKRSGAGRKAKAQPIDLGHGNSQDTKDAAAEILEALNRPAPKAGEPAEPYEIQKFRLIDDDPDKSLDLRRWLYDKRDGKAPQKVKLDGNVNLIARRERIREMLARLAGTAGS